MPRHHFERHPPLYVLSKLTALLISSVMYSAILTVLYFAGCGSYLGLEEDSPVNVAFVENAPKTLGEEKESGDDPEKPEEKPPEIVPVIELPEAPVTVVDTQEDETVPAAPETPAAFIIAPGPSSAVGTGLIGDRTKGGRDSGSKRYGGSGAAENAVKAALRWLAAHQDDDGKWSARNYTRHDPPGDPSGPAARGRHSGLPDNYDVAVTGLSLLCFLGHGNTHQDGEYKKVVGRGLDYLLARQSAKTGSFGSGDRTSMYNQGIATLFLAEAYAMTKDPKLRRPLARAVNQICQAQQKSGGWDYTEYKTNRNDTSVTGWQVMALKSAHAAGINVPWETTYGILKHFERVTDEEGYVGYTNHRTNRNSIALVGVGLLSNGYLGFGRNHPTVRRQTAILLQHLPAWHKLRGRNSRGHSMYYWYYGTLGMFHVGGREWRIWNNSMRDMLIRAQCTKGSRHGSWDPDGHWARGYAGRVYSTALMCLTLEVYYRYLPMYESKDTLGVGKALVQQVRDETGGAHKVALLRKLALFDDPELPTLLKDLLKDENPTVRFTAAKYLAERGDKTAIPFLEAGLRHKEPFYRFNAIRSLEELDHPDTLPALIYALDDELVQNADRAARSLRKKTGVSFGFRADAPIGEKRRIVASWKTWWKNNRERLGSLPDIRGTVVAARGGGAKVLVKVGEDDPIAVGMRLRVFRHGKHVGYIQVGNVLRGGMAEASVTSWELPNSAIAKGDLIGTREPPKGDTR